MASKRCVVVLSSTNLCRFFIPFSFGSQNNEKMRPILDLLVLNQVYRIIFSPWVVDCFKPVLLYQFCSVFARLSDFGGSSAHLVYSGSLFLIVMYSTTVVTYYKNQRLNFFSFVGKDLFCKSIGQSTEVLLRL